MIEVDKIVTDRYRKNVNLQLELHPDNVTSVGHLTTRHLVTRADSWSPKKPDILTLGHLTNFQTKGHPDAENWCSTV